MTLTTDEFVQLFDALDLEFYFSDKEEQSLVKVHNPRLHELYLKIKEGAQLE